MAKPTLYKKEALNNVRNRTTTPLTEDEKGRVDTIIIKFTELFKDEHLS